MTPLDLTVRPPRSPRALLDGMLVFARVIDKLRGALPDGKLGEYSIAGLSGQFYGFFRVTAEELYHCIEEAESDDDVVQWLHQRVHIDDDMRKTWNAVAENHVVTNGNREHVYANYPVARRNPHMTNLLDVLELDDQECFGLGAPLR